MALNFTPLRAYTLDVMSGIQQDAANRNAAAQGFGAILGTAKALSDAQKTRDFFAQFDDTAEIEGITAHIAENEAIIKSLREELETLGGE